MRVLRQFEIVQSSIVVVRYFGGIKLGKRGLINAYYESAKNVVMKSKLVRWENIHQYEIQCPIKYFGVLSKYVSKKKYKILQDTSKEKLKWIIQIDKNKEERKKGKRKRKNEKERKKREKLRNSGKTLK